MLRSLCKSAVQIAPLVLAASACHVESRGGAPVAFPYDVWEQEPNDTNCCPNNMGWVSVGDAFVIGGAIRDDALDPFDGFLLRNTGPCSIRFTLEPLDGVSDLDLCVWDPLVGDFAFCFESGDSIEQGVFNVPNGGDAFHLVVASYFGRSEYRLHVCCEPIGLGLTAGDAPAAVQGSATAGHFAPYAGSPAPASLPPPRVGPLWVLDHDEHFEHLELREGVWFAPAAPATGIQARSEE